jgi:predicted molibdopterin-dependent oxidoreductase YjgC
MMPGRGFGRPLARLTQPLVRRGGNLQPVGWDEALDHVAARLRDIRERHGSDAFCCFSCSKASNEMNFAAQKFMRQVLGTNNIDSCNRT